MTGHVIFEDDGTGLNDQQDRDWADAASLQAATHDGLDPGGLLRGLAVDSVDWTVPEVTLTEGLVKCRAESVSMRAHGEQTTWPETTVSAQVDGETLALPAGETVGIWVDISLTSGSPNDVSLVVVGAGDSTPSTPALKIGEVDTAADTVSEQWHLVAADMTLTFPDEAAASSAASELPNGTVVYGRSEEIHWSTIAGSLKRLATWSDPDGDGVYQLPSDTDGIDVATVSATSEMNLPTYPTRSDVPQTEGLFQVDDVDGSGRTGVILRVS